MNWTIGADIEVMLEKDGRLVSAVPLLPANDRAEELPHGGVFHDNVLAEFTVEPAKNHEEFARNILGNMDAILAKLAKDNIKTRVVASARYPTAELETDQAKRFGCQPDFDAYDLVRNIPTDDANETDLRTAGGHIHFSHPIFEGGPEVIVKMIKLMDLFLGVPSITMDTSKAAAERRVLYGRAGAHRPKNYPGGEYRTLSNFWAKDAKSITWAYKQTEKCLELLLDNQTVETLGVDEVEVRRIINEADVTAATQLTSTLNGLG